MVKKLGLHECLRSEEDRVVRETGMKRDDILYFSTGDRLKQRGFELDIIGPVGAAGKSTGSAGSSANVSSNGESTSENENSMVAKAIFRKDPLFGKNSEVSVLITGDIDEKAEVELVAAYGTMDCDIVAVPHHGSRYSSSESFISAVSPSAAVIQVGKNNMYGHPAPEVIKRYEDAGVKVFRNDTQGAVGILGKRIRLMLDHKVR
jgi:competence protein ComEC